MTLAVVGTAVIYMAVLIARRRLYGPPGSAGRPRRSSVPLRTQASQARESVRTLRTLGFFRDEAALSDEELARRLSARIEAESGVPVAELARTPQQLDVWIALHDDRRGCRLPDKYFYPGEDAFLQVIALCARLEGVGPFEPLGEEWAHPDGPVDVRFSIDGREASCTIPSPKYLDPKLVGALNAGARRSGRRLRVTDALGMPNVVFTLTDREAATLVRERGWQFHPDVP